ncbi:MAG: YraN family protein, partial [bacterium]
MTTNKTNNKKTGNYGESLAVEYLVSRGYKILERNLNLNVGEIDILAREKNITVIVEVKTVRGTNYGPAKGYVNLKKQHKLKLLALELGQKYKLNHIRIDVIGIDLSDPETPIIEH